MPQLNDFPFARHKTIGILGGGQLARMLCAAAGQLGFSTIILDPVGNCPAAQFANHQIIATYDDSEALELLGNACRFTTYEFENVPVASAQYLSKICEIYPGPKALEISQDRLVEKQFINGANMQTARFIAVSNKQQFDKAFQSIASPAILKTRRLGYDGKGQIRLNGENLETMMPRIEAILNVECVLEEMVDFDCEISVIAARDLHGNTACYDPARNHHQEGILMHSKVPCALPDNIVEKAKAQTCNLMHELQYVGVIGVEFFVTKSGDLLTNEFAPRVHNSGHWTQAACLISQFEQHIRAITHLPLGSTARHADCEMQNLIGEAIGDVSQIAMAKNTQIHDYGKLKIRNGRKMGHFTTIFPRSGTNHD